jgi:hypothetical protein
MMKKTLLVTVVMMAVTLMTFAGGFNFGPKGELAEGAAEIAQLEKEYQLISLLNYTGFSKAQLDEIISVVEETQAELAKVEEDVAEELAEAIELAKAGDTEEAVEKHDAAIDEKGTELAAIKEEFTTTLKGLITVEQQEKMMQYAVKTAMNGMRRSKDFAEKMAIGTRDEQVQGRNGETAGPVLENVKKAVMNSERFKQLPEEIREKVQQFAGNIQNNAAGRNPIQMMQTMKQAAPNVNASTMFFGALLIEDNLEIVKDYAAGLTE